MPGVGQAPQEAPQWQAAGPCLAPVLTYPTRATLVPYTSVIIFSYWAHYQPLHLVICQRLGSRLLSSVIKGRQELSFLFLPDHTRCIRGVGPPRSPLSTCSSERSADLPSTENFNLIDCEVTIRVAQIVEHNCTLFLCSLDVRNIGDQCRVPSIKEKDHLAG